MTWLSGKSAEPTVSEPPAPEGALLDGVDSGLPPQALRASAMPTPAARPPSPRRVRVTGCFMRYLLERQPLLVRRLRDFRQPCGRRWNRWKVLAGGGSSAPWPE